MGVVGWGNGGLAAKRGEWLIAMKERGASLEATLGQLATRGNMAGVRDDVRATGDRLARRLKVVGVGVVILIALEVVSIGVSWMGLVR